MIESNAKTYTETLADQIRILSDDKVAIANEEGIYTYAISDLLNQPIEGLLYDLNRDTATNYNRLKQGDIRAINDIAIAKILTRIITLNKILVI